jgi:hypothetical protein
MRRVKFFILLAASLSLTSCGSGPTSVAERFVEAVDAGHTAEAVQYFDPALREVGGPKLMAALDKPAQAARQKGGLKDVEATENKVDGDYAAVTVEERFANGTNAKTDFKMRRVDGKWFVTM